MAIKKKKPTDYPHLGFRLSEEDKTEIIEKVNKLVKISNEVSEGPKLIRKNDIIVKALKKGLVQLEKELKS